MSFSLDTSFNHRVNISPNAQNTHTPPPQKTSPSLLAEIVLNAPTASSSKKRKYIDNTKTLSENSAIAERKKGRESPYTAQEIEFLITHGLDDKVIRGNPISRINCIDKFTAEFPGRGSSGIRFKLDTIIGGRHPYRYTKRFSKEQIQFVFQQRPPESIAMFYKNFQECLEKYKGINESDYIALVKNLHSRIGDKFRINSFDDQNANLKRQRRNEEQPVANSESLNNEKKMPPSIAEHFSYLLDSREEQSMNEAGEALTEEEDTFQEQPILQSPFPLFRLTTPPAHLRTMIENFN